MAYVRKTVDRWDIETNYGYGWEVEDCEYSRTEAKKTLERVSRKFLWPVFRSVSKAERKEGLTMKTTTKEARQNIRQYILDHFDPCGYDFTGPCSFPNVARFILAVHAEEKAYSPEYQSRKGYTNEQVFIDWAQGLPSVLDTCYFYNRSAVDDLGEILEQSEREKAKYTEREAELMLTHLIYRELKRGAAEK